MLLAVALFATLMVIADRDAEDKRRAAAAAEASRKANMTPEQQAKQKADEARTTAMRAQAVIGAVALRRSMKDPESFLLRSLVLMRDGASCYDYRAKNSFGAILPSSAVLTANGKMLLAERNGNHFVSAWNASCTKEGGEDLTEIAIETLLKGSGR